MKAPLQILAVLAVLAAMKVAAPVLVPVFLALFVVVIGLPLLSAMRRRGVPRVLATAGVVLLDVAVIVGLGWIAVRSGTEFREMLPQYVERMRGLEADALAWAAAHDIPLPETPYADLLSPERLLSWTTSALQAATSLATYLFLVLLLTAFMLVEATHLPGKIRHALGPQTDLGRFAQIATHVQRYLAVKAGISLATGAAIALLTWLAGLDVPLLWGLLAFLLNFIPNVGSVLAAVPAIGVALLQMGPTGALVVAGIYLAVNVLLGNILEPALVGRRMGLSTLVVLLSLLVWGWLWGPIGMFLSVPMTLAAKMALEGSESYRWLAVLLGPPLPKAREAAEAERGSTPPAPVPTG